MANFFDQVDAPAGNFFDQADELPPGNFFDQADEGQGAPPAEATLQTPLETGARAAGTGLVQSVTGVQSGIGEVRQSLSDLARQYVGDLPSQIFDTLTVVPRKLGPMAQQAGQAAQQFFAPDAERNPKSAAIGSGLGQAPAMIGATLVAGPAAPLVMGGFSGYGSGAETAREIGLTDPLAIAGMGAGFAGMEVATERMFGLGNKAATEALQAAARRSLPQMVGSATRSTLGEGAEEIIAGTGQDALAAAMAPAGYDVSRFQVMDPETGNLNQDYLNRRGLEALGGMAGGAVFSGVDALINARKPPTALANRPAPQGELGATNPQPRTENQQPPTPNDLPESLGDLTAEDVADLEAPSPPVSPSPSPQVSESPSLPVSESPTPPTASVNEAIPTVPQRGPASVDPGIAGPTPATGALSPASADGATTNPIPLGLARPVTQDTRLEAMSDDAFLAERQAADRELTQLENDLDQNPDRYESGEPRARLAAAQDRYESVELEQFRRNATDTHPGDLFREFVNLADLVDEPSDGSSRSANAAKMKVLHDEVRRQSPSDTTLLEGWDFVQGSSLERSADYREVTSGKLAKAKRWADYFNQASTSSPSFQVSESPSPQVSESSAPSPRALTNLNPSGNTVVAVRNDGSTIIFNELIDLAARAVQRGVTFAQWAADTVRRLGASVRDYLESAWQAATTRTMPRMGGGRVTVRRPEGGFIRPASAPSAGPSGPVMKETESRFASPDPAQNEYEVQGNDRMMAEASAWLDGNTVADALAAMESNTPPVGLRIDHMPALGERLLQRLTAATDQGTEIQQLEAETLLQRAGAAWQGQMSQEAGRTLQQRAAASARLVPIAPILAAKQVLVDRAEAVMTRRFEGGAAGAVEKITNILNDAQTDISGRVEAILNAVLGSRLKPRVTIREAVAGLVNGKTQRDEMIEDVARALMQKAKSSQVKPEQKTALAALVASLKRTLGAAVRGKALKPDALSFGELLARTFVDQVAEAPLFEQSWMAGREQVRLMLIELGMTEAEAMKRLNELMPDTPTVAYAPGMVKQAVKRGFEAAGYGQTLATGADQRGQREVDVRAEVLRNPQKAMDAVMRVWDAEAQAGGISPEAWTQGRQLAARALNETLQQWQKQAAEATAKAAQATKNRLLAKDSPALVKLLKEMAAKIAPGMTWADIFTDLPSTQKERQREIYRRLMLDQRLQGLTPEQRLKLTNELDQAWQRERRKVFQAELKKAGVLGEKAAGDRARVEKALPKLMRMINLGMFNSAMWREAVAPEYGLRTLTTAQSRDLRKQAEEAWKQPEGVLRNQKMRALLEGIQRATGASKVEILNSYWTSAVLSGLRTQFDTWAAAINGFGTNLIQAGTLMARGRGRAAVEAHGQWWRGLYEGIRESGQILYRGDTSYLKRFGADVNRALQGESGSSPVPLGELLWKNGNKFQKYGLAPVMMFTGRLMAAADHVNNTATTQGAMAVARALHPELYGGKAAFTAAERANARQQALREVTGGTPPTTSTERAQVSARSREILNGTINETQRLEASEIGDMAAFQNDPTGFFGFLYDSAKAGLGTAQRRLGAVADDAEAYKATRALTGLLAGSLHAITGTRFMRFGFNFGAELTRYMPGTYALGKAGFYGRDVSRMQQELLLGKNVVGLMIASTLAALFVGDDDDLEDDTQWQIEGTWADLTPEQQKQRMSAGIERMTMWRRKDGKVQRVSYKQWPTMSLFAVVGGMKDEQRHKPKSFEQRGVTGHLLRGASTGMYQIINVSAMRNLADLFSSAGFGTDPLDAQLDKVTKTGTNYAGGLIPTVIKDVEIWNDPRNFKPEGVWEGLARSIPILRSSVNDGRPQLNMLGDEVKLQRSPWSRSYTSVESAEAHRVLGSLLARGLSLPLPSSEVSVFQNGVKVPLESLGREAVWKYEKAVGVGYKEWLGNEGADLLKLPVATADKVIKRRAAAIKRVALFKARG
jgi:hypothetical protein